MEQVLEAFGKAGWKAALERMQLLNLTNDFRTDGKHLQQLVQEHVQTSKQLARYHKAVLRTTPSPLTILKQAVLLHLHIQLAPKPNSNAVLSFASLLLLRCDATAEMYGEAEG